MLVTVGHGTAGGDRLGDLLQQAEVGRLVDIRRFPGSRRDPTVGRDALAALLSQRGIGYRWEPRLGGRRRVRAYREPATDAWWRVEAFRAYAAHMRTDEFGEGMADLLADLQADVERASAGHTAVLCSETVWWRCHRRLVSDAAVLLHGHDVRHLGHDGRLTPHPPSPGARVTSEGLVYDLPRDEA